MAIFRLLFHQNILLHATNPGTFVQLCAVLNQEENSARKAQKSPKSEPPASDNWRESYITYGLENYIFKHGGGIESSFRLDLKYTETTCEQKF
ncbi:hypothetical protein E4T56_gene5924 [Termitomyces sp. T112]|nr:hypothetical protein E4T56_gene5924 [Termitomyces sp. T112]